MYWFNSITKEENVQVKKLLLTSVPNLMLKGPSMACSEAE